MPYLMSFALTTRQILDRSKTVTRREGWTFLKAGDVLEAVNKKMGLKKGESPERYGLLKVVSVRLEPLSAISADDVAREGFPGWTPEQFVNYFCKHMKGSRNRIVNRIEFEYL